MERELLTHLFDIDFRAGKLFWRNPPKQHPRLLGTEAGCPRANRNGKKYWVVKIGGKAFKRGRLMFLAFHGVMPDPQVDHWDGNSLNDKPGNLREATGTQNAWNHRKRARRIPLPMGVRSMKSGRFQARIAVNKKMIHLGAFETPDLAHAKYIEARKEFYREFA